MHDSMRRTWGKAVAGWAAALLLAAAAAAGLCSAAQAAAAMTEVEYHRPTDLFNVLDNLPDWLPGYTSSAYREHLERLEGLDEADRASLAAYAAFRQRTSPLTGNTAPEDAPVELFAPASTREAEPFARFFYESRDWDTGAAAAIAAQAPGDQAMLREFFARFVPRAERLLGTGQDFAAARAALAQQLAEPAVARLGEAIRTFYVVPPAPRFVARFVWWPDAASTQAKVRGRYILLHSPHEAAAGDEAMDWAPIVLHEFAHYVSASQPAERKAQLGAAYLQRCPAAAALRNPLNAFEEPLAIYWGQYRFEHDVRGQALSFDEGWYLQPWADRAAKAIARAFPASGPAPELADPALVAAAASACGDPGAR